jgi:hypothetical protein
MDAAMESNLFMYFFLLLRYFAHSLRLETISSTRLFAPKRFVDLFGLTLDMAFLIDFFWIHGA